MASNTGEHDDVPNDPTAQASTALVVAKGFQATKLLDQALGRSEPPSNAVVPVADAGVRRGRFFLSSLDQQRYGSLRRPIFAVWGHGVVVGQMDYYPERDGCMCYGTHDDFDRIPEFTPLNEWPEYERTETGWIRKDGRRRLEDVERSERLLSTFKTVQRLK